MSEKEKYVKSFLELIFGRGKIAEVKEAENQLDDVSISFEVKMKNLKTISDAIVRIKPIVLLLKEGMIHNNIGYFKRIKLDFITENGKKI